MIKSCFIYFFILFVINAGECKDTKSKIKGRVCAYGDMNRDLYTDLIVQTKQHLKIYHQDEEGEFHDSSVTINLMLSQSVSCSIGDFNGDILPDILVTRKKANQNGSSEFECIIYINEVHKFRPVSMNESFMDEVAVMDINGDGTSDLLGFLQNNSIFCRLGDSTQFMSCDDTFRNFDSKPYPNFLHAFVDVTGDLSAEIIFGTKHGDKLKLNAWKRISDTAWKYDPSLIADIPDLSCKTKYYGATLYADFNADGLIDIGVPCCSDENCAKVEVIMMWNSHFKQWQDYRISGLESFKLVSKKEEGNVIFRIGDFSMDGYPDLIALIRETTQNPMIFENVPCNDCISNATRKFELRTSPRLIQPADVSLGEIQMVSFFDLKEDGSLDVLLEYRDVDRSDMAIDFIPCDDKGDTTFLKVQVFTKVCSKDCDQLKAKIGSGIAWHGACISFNKLSMWGIINSGVQCQLPQTTHRVLHSNSALFGFRRSPSFIDEVCVGSPRFISSSSYNGYQRYELKQIMPNSRIIVVPPDTSLDHWQSRLYLTPNKIFIQTSLILVLLCILLLLVICILHYRERRADTNEKLAQSYRFYFDAM